MLKSFFHFYLAMALGFGATVFTLLQTEQNPAGFYAQICGSGQSIFIALNENETPKKPDRHTVACHAICSGRDLLADEDDC